MIEIGPSIICMDFSRMQEEIHDLEKAKVDFLHIDVMDGRFVPNLTLGPFLIKCMRKLTKLPLDVHLMIEEPERSLDDYLEAGADSITIHAESTNHLQKLLRKINDSGIKAGVSLNPSSSEELIRYVADDIHRVLVMSVNPGFSGQSFIKSSLSKIARLKNLLPKNVNIMVDGGINDTTIGPCYKNGATSFVLGSFFFKHKNYQEAMRKIKAAI